MVSHRRHAVFQPGGALPGTLHPASEKSILLKYRIVFQPGPVDRDATERQWQQFAKQK